MFDQFNQQVTPFVIGEPRAEVFDVQGVGRADQFQQLTQAGRKQAALPAGEQHQVVTNFRPGHARAGVADQNGAIFQAAEEAFFVDLDAGNQLWILGLGHKLAEPSHQQTLITHVFGEQCLKTIQSVTLDLRWVAGRLRVSVAVALFVRQELAEKVGEMGENFSGAWRTEAYGIRHTVILSGTTVGQKRRQIEHVAGFQNPFFSFNEFSKDLQIRVLQHWAVGIAHLTDLPATFAVTLQKEHIVVVEVRAYAAARYGEADHHVIDAPLG